MALEGSSLFYHFGERRVPRLVAVTGAFQLRAGRVLFMLHDQDAFEGTQRETFPHPCKISHPSQNAEGEARFNGLGGVRESNGSIE